MYQIIYDIEKTAGFNEVNKRPLKYKSLQEMEIMSDISKYGLDGLVCGVDFNKNISQDFVSGYGFTKNGITDKMEFDGVDDYLMCKYPLKNLNNVTMVLKVKIYEGACYGILGTMNNVNVGNGCGSWVPNIFLYNGSIDMVAYNSNDTTCNISGNEVLDNKYHIMVICGNSGVVKFYLDGVKKGENSRGINQTWCEQFTLGTNWDSGGRRYNRNTWTYGKCDVGYFLVYTRVLSDVEIGEFR